MKDEEKALAEQAKEQIKAVHEDGCATINGRDYRITNVNHKKRRKVFSYFTHVQHDLNNRDFWFLESPEWASIEEVISNIVTFDGQLLSKLPDHWEKHPEDYLLFIQTMLGAISYPFLAGVSGS